MGDRGGDARLFNRIHGRYFEIEIWIDINLTLIVLKIN